MNRTRAVGVGVVVAVGVAVAFSALQRRGATDVERRPIGSDTVVMLGDSITALGDWGRLLPDRAVSNAGHVGFTTEQLVPIAADVAARRPAAVFVLTGTNDIRDGLGPSVTAEHLGRLLDEIRRRSPATVIVVQTVLPRSDAADRVRATNDAIRAVAEADGAEVLDLHAEFDDGRGGLRSVETTDGIHLAPAGYARWADVVERRLDELDVADPGEVDG